jgi:hypothetical protein
VFHWLFLFYIARVEAFALSLAWWGHYGELKEVVSGLPEGAEAGHSWEMYPCVCDSNSEYRNPESDSNATLNQGPTGRLALSSIDQEEIAMSDLD